MKRRFALSTMAAAFAAAALPASAQSWQAATVKLVVPYPPGTEPDVLARDLARLLAQKTGKAFVVENKAGANSIIGTQQVVKAAPDGSELLVVDRSALVINPLLYRNVPYRWDQALAPVADLTRVDLFVAVRADLPARNYKEFVELARKSAGGLNVATGGNGHITHIGMAMLAQAEGVHFHYVPYKGVAPAVLGAISGDVDAAMAGGLALQPQHRAGKLRILVGGGETRAAILPDVPTIEEAGGQAGSIPSTVFALFVPSATPAALAGAIGQAVHAVLEAPEFRSACENRGSKVQEHGPAQVASLMAQDAARYAKIVGQLGIQPE